MKKLYAGITLVGVMIAVGLVYRYVKGSLDLFCDEELDMDFGYDPMTRFDEDQHH